MREILEQQCSSSSRIYRACPREITEIGSTESRCVGRAQRGCAKTHTSGDTFGELEKWELVERVKDVPDVSQPCSNIWRVAQWYVCISHVMLCAAGDCTSLETRLLQVEPWILHSGLYIFACTGAHASANACGYLLSMVLLHQCSPNTNN